MNKLGKHTMRILREMVRRVKGDIKKLDLARRDKHWYHDHEWSKIEERAFERWLVDYLYKNAVARQELMTIPSFKTKDLLKKVAHEWTFNYGWRVKDEKKD